MSSPTGSAPGTTRRSEEEIRPPCTLVIFGASGDLTRRLLAPAIAHLNRDGAISPDFAIVGIGRTHYTDEEFRRHLEEGAREFTPPTQGRPGDLPAVVRYVAGDFGDPDLYRNVRGALDAIEGKRGGRAQPDLLFRDAPRRRRADPPWPRRGGADPGRERLGARGRRETVRPRPRVRPALERGPPQGLPREADLPDRPLPRQGDGPEHLRPALRQRHLRADVEPPLRRPRPDLGGRVGRASGIAPGSTRRRASCATCSRTTCMQLLTLTAMEPPAAYEADAIRAEKVKVLESIRPFRERRDRRVGRARAVRPGRRRRQARARATARRRRSIRSPRRRPTPRSRSRSTTGAGRACRSTCVPASGWPSG